MTKREFVERHQKEILGILLEAAMGRRSGADAWAWTIGAAKTIQARLGEAFDDLQPTVPDSKPATNGAAPTVRK